MKTKTKLAGVLFFTVAAAASAQLSTVDDLMAAIEAQPESERGYVVIPIVGDAGGRAGARYRTDVSLEAADYDDFPAAAAFLPLSRDGSSESLYFVPATSTWNAAPPVWTNFALYTLDRLDFGAVVVAAVDSTQSSLSNRRLIARGDIHVDMAGSCAVSASMPFTAARPSRSGRAGAPGLRIGDGYRTNVGIVNLDRAAHVFTVRAAPADGGGPTETQVMAQPRSLTIAALPSGGASSLAVEVEADGQQGEWTAWAASVHESSGDSWFTTLLPY